MNAITQEINLNLIPGAIPPRISVSQYDDASRSLVFRLYSGAVSFTPGSGTTAQIRGTKPDNKGFEYAANLSGSTVTAAITDQMTAVAGDVRCEIVLKDSTKTIGTGNFVLAVERAALGEDTDISETVIPDIIDAAEANAERAEAAADRAEEASVHAPYIGQNEDWYVWDTVNEQYVDSGVDARGDDGEDGTSIANITKTGTSGLVDTYTVTLTDGTTYTFTVTNGQNGQNGQDGQDGADGEDGVGIADIEKTSTVGLVDTYTITLTDQTTYTFTVTNGQNAIPGGGTTGQVLTKLSNTSGDAGWQTPASGSSSLADLTDTTITTPADGEVLVYDGTAGKWVNDEIETATSLSELTDTTITSPSDGQILAYDGTAGKWVNTTQSSGTGVLTYEIVTKSTGGTSAAVTVNKYINKSRRSSTDYLYTQAQTPVTIDDKIVLDYGSTASGKWTYRLLEASEDHAVGYSDSWAYSATVDKMEEYESQENPDTLDTLDDVSLDLPISENQPLTYDPTSGKWENGGVIPIANGGTGNNTGYVQAGQKANTTIGANATAEGIRTTASGNQSHAEGVDTLASNTSAHAEGGNTQATGLSSHAEGGGGVVASGASSHAEGGATQASGTYSHAEGQSTKAQATGAHAQNYNATASGNYSSAAGYYTTAGYQNQFVIGKYNDNKSANIFEVGIGTGTGAKANGLELDTSGNLTVAGDITDGSGNTLSAMMSYLEQTVTLSTSASTTVTFTDSSITANSFIEYACSQWDLVPESITGAAGSCTIVLPKVDSAQSVTVRIYVR